MKLSTKVVLIWVGVLTMYFLCLRIFPSIPSPISAHINQFIQSLLFIISVFIFIREQNRKNRLIFINFSAYFSLSLLSLCYDFVGKTIFLDRYARHLFGQYLTIAYIFFLSVAIVYIVIDLLFKDFKILQKYLVTFSIVTIFFAVYFHNFFTNPLYLYSTERIQQWKSLDTYVSANGSKNPIELANSVTLQSWDDGVAVGNLFPDKNLEKIIELYPYLEKDNWKVLLLEPLYTKVTSINVMIVFFILLFFGYQYKKDPPQGAYIDKIMFLVLLFSSMDILHNWGFTKSIEWGSLTELFTIGQYITILAELMMVLFFALRLRFITSVQGEFYESELAVNPNKISRWRDWVDNFVLAHFFNYKIFNGRLFQKTSGKRV